MLSKINKNIISNNNLKNLDSIFDYIYCNDNLKNINSDSIFRANIEETNNLFIIYANLKGATKKDITISYQNKFLIVEVFSKSTLTSNKRMFFVDEIHLNNVFTSFQNSILKIVILKDNRRIPAV